MINKIKRKLSVRKFQTGGINLLPPPNQQLMLPPGGSAVRPIMPGVGGSGTIAGGPGFGTQIPASVRSMTGFQQAAMSAWPKIKNYGTLGLNTPYGRAAWLASLGIPWVANQTRKTADKIERVSNGKRMQL